MVALATQAGRNWLGWGTWGTVLGVPLLGICLSDGANGELLGYNVAQLLCAEARLSATSGACLGLKAPAAAEKWLGRS